MLTNYIDEVKVYNFRNIEEIYFKTFGQNVFIYGKNGVGKTNLLESLSILAKGRGLRFAKFEDIKNINTKKPWTVNISMNIMNEKLKLGAEYNSKKIIKLDSNPIICSKQIHEIIDLSWFSNEMLIDFSSKSMRRKFFDRLILLFDDAHSSNFIVYEKLMRERNAILQVNVPNFDFLTEIENKMEFYANAICKTRITFLHELNHLLDFNHSIFINVDNMDYDHFKGLSHKLLLDREVDKNLGYSSYGPNRSDFCVVYDGMPLHYSSTGQIKMILLNIILKSFDFSDSSCKVLLLDDLGAYLHDEYLESFLSKVNGIQLFISDNIRRKCYEEGFTMVDLGDLTKDIAMQ